MTRTPAPPPRPARRPDPRLIALAVVAAVIGLWLVFSSTQGATPTATTTASGSSATSSSTRPTASGTDPTSGLPWVDLAALPKQAAETMAEIKAGPPYPYPKNDGVIFHNAERLLPAKPDGYYHEFTVVTPGSSTRGARRIIAGGPKMGQTNSEWYYTSDHYSSFERIRP